MQDERITDSRSTARSTPSALGRQRTGPHARSGRLLGAVTALAALLGGAVFGASPTATAETTRSAPAAAADAASDARIDAVGALVRERLVLADTVAQAKWIAGTPVSDPTREQVVIDTAVTQARQRGVDEDLVRRMMTAQIAASKVVQRGLLTRWAHDRADAPASAPDLTALRARLDALDSALVDALGDAAPAAEEPRCAHLVDRERDREYPGMDGLHRRGVHAAWQTFCAAEGSRAQG